MKNIDVRKMVITGAAAVLVYWLAGVWGSIHLPLGLSLRPQLLVLVVAAVWLGPVQGAAAGLLGQLWLGVAGGVVWWSVALAAAFTGLATGWLCRGNEVGEGWFSAKDARRFALWQLPVQVVATGLITPVLDMLLYRDALGSGILRGLLAAVVNWLWCAVPGIALLVLVAKLCARFVWRAPKPPHGGQGQKRAAARQKSSGAQGGNAQGGSPPGDAAPQSVFDYEWEP